MMVAVEFSGYSLWSVYDGTSLNREDCVGCRYFKCCKSASCLYGNYKMTGYLNKTNSFFCGYRKILYRINEEKL